MHNYVKSICCIVLWDRLILNFFQLRKKSGPKSQSLEKQILLSTLVFVFVLFVCLFVWLVGFLSTAKNNFKNPTALT